MTEIIKTKEKHVTEEIEIFFSSGEFFGELRWENGELNHCSIKTGDRGSPQLYYFFPKRLAKQRITELRDLLNAMEDELAMIPEE